MIVSGSTVNQQKNFSNLLPLRHESINLLPPQQNIESSGDSQSGTQFSDQTDESNPNNNSSYSASINIKSSVSSSDGVITENYELDQTVNGENHKESVTRTSDDGSSRVDFSIDVDTNSESSVRVRERGDRLDIDFREKTKVNN